MRSYLQNRLKKMLDGIFKINEKNSSINWDGAVTLKSVELDPQMFSNLSV